MITLMRLTWRVDCGRCAWWRSVESREEGIAAGRTHVAERHEEADEWEFRVRGIRYPLDGRTVTMGGITYPAHEWEPHPKSRDRNLPCGVCRIYRSVHDSMYGADGA